MSRGMANVRGEDVRGAKVLHVDGGKGPGSRCPGADVRGQKSYTYTVSQKKRPPFSYDCSFHKY